MKRLFTAWRDVDASNTRPVLVVDGNPKPPASDAPKKRPATTAFFTKPTREPAVAPSITHVVYSSSSSDGSVVQTPEPDDVPQTITTPRWSSWIKSKPSKPKTTHVAAVWDSPRPPPAPLPPPPPPPPPQPESDDDDDDESDHYGDEADPTPTPAPQRTTTRILQPATVLRAQKNLRALTLAALVPPLSLPPLLHLPTAPLFPRSTNPSRKLPRLQNTHSVLLRTTLVRRIEARSLSRAENESIVQFGDRPVKAVPKARPGRPNIDDEAVLDVNKKLRHHSRGLQLWLDRPCFEDRCVLWTWDPQRGELIARNVIGSGRAVASLEFSEGIEALAGYGLQPQTPTAPKIAPILQPLHITSPSTQHETISSAASTPNASTGPSTPTNGPHSTIPRKILRFVPEPEDDEDNIPLGYQVRGRRHLEELERQAEERARKAEEGAREEERIRKVLANEVKAARERREGARSGSMHNAELERQKDRRENYARPAYDTAVPRRMASEPDTRRPSSLSRPPSVTEASPHVKSRPPSIRSERMSVPHIASSSLQHPPLPRSITTQTMEDEKRRRRASAVSEGGSISSSMRHAPSLPPQFMGMMPPVPPMPIMTMYPAAPGTPQFFYMQAQAQAQMPLLPPTRPWLPASRSMEGLPRDASKSHNSHHASSQGGSSHDTRRRSSTPGSRQ